MKKLRLALDWTPNTNHIGFFVANELGYYKGEGLQVEILDPQVDNYKITPAKKVELGEADFALCPFESIISYQTKRQEFDAVAIATIFQEDLSGIVVLESSTVKTPKDLDGKSYASYKARYEDEIVRQMILNDGGAGEFELEYPEKLGIWDTLLSKKFDATWIFLNWEGVQAKNKGIPLRVFRLTDFGIPYAYSPVIMASKKKVDFNKKEYASFLDATKKGFLFALDNPEKAAKILAPFVSKSDADIDLLESQKLSIEAYGNPDEWGKMEEHKVNSFLNWLKVTGLESAELNYQDLVYTGLLP